MASHLQRATETKDAHKSKANRGKREICRFGGGKERGEKRQCDHKGEEEGAVSRERAGGRGRE